MPSIPFPGPSVPSFRKISRRRRGSFDTKVNYDKLMNFVNCYQDNIKKAQKGELSALTHHNNKMRDSLP